MPLLLHLLSLLAIGVQSYNLDVENMQVFEDPQASNNGRPSYFGFSVALAALGSDSLLLVGAPRANSTYTMGGFIEPGVVYYCHLNSNGSCVEWPVDPWPYSPINNQNSNMKSKNYAWLGATISVQNMTRKPKVAVCAPRWTNIAMHNEVYEKWYLNGMCYSTTAIDNTSFSRPASRKHMPMSNNERQTIDLPSNRYEKKAVHYQAMGQVGFSMHLIPGIAGNFILGAPGFYHWTGTTVFLDERDQRSPGSGIIGDVIRDPHLQFDNYMGYSVTSGRFYKLSERLFASSAPRSGAAGKVFLHGVPYKAMSSKYSFRKIIEGEQYGEYFGASLTSCDINGDARDDLIIGAPLWSKVSDEGRVYVYKTKGQVEFEVQRIEGEQESGRFGTVVNCLNDLDFDDYADVAVGAPYEDNGRGAVYIFNGSPEGLSLQPSQRIRAVELSAMNLRGLGMSISEPRDVDGNRFPDVAFGAYGSGHALLLRSRPVVTLNLKLVKSQNFTLMQNATYFILDLCTFYDGPFAPASFVVTKTLTIDEVHKRAIVYQNGRLFGNIYRVSNTLKRGEEKCAPIKINLKKNVQNLLDPIEIMGNITSNENSNCTYCPVINPRLSQVSDNLKLAYILDCGADDVCNSELRVTITSVNDNNSFIIGSNSTYNISIVVENTAEPAYKSQAHVYIPSPMTLARIPPECDEKLELNRTLEVVCSLGNPLRFNNTITMELDMRAVNYYEESNEIEVLVRTQSEEENTSNNLAKFNIFYFVDANITIEGKSDGDLHSFVEQDIIDKNYQTVTFNQIYEIWKIGVTPLQETIVIINVPTHWNEEEITKIRQVRISVDGKDHDCDGLFNEELNSTLYDFEFIIDKNSSLATPSEEHTFFINCTDQHTRCQKFECQLGPLLKNQSLATLTMTIDLRLPNATERDYKGKDVIYFVSEGFVKTEMLKNLTEKLFNDLFDYKLLATNLFIRRKPEQVATWIIIVSVLLGIILIVLLALLLIKIGFFNRKRKEDLDAMRSTNQLTVLND